MTRIDGTGPILPMTTTRRTAKTSAPSGTSFSKHLDDSAGASEAAPLQETSPLSSLSGVLNIQEVDDALARASRGRRRAEDILEKLEDLQMALLDGSLSLETLQRLAQAVHSRKNSVTDPKLAAILEEIDLRAQVELAKFTQT